MSERLTITNADRALQATDKEFVQLFRHGTLEVEWYRPKNVDRQEPHSRDEVYVCGENGILLKGNRNGWKFIGDPDLTDHFWDLEVFEGKVYLAAENTLKVYDGKTIDPVETKLEPPPDAHHLSSRNGILWSFGEDHLAHFDGKTWTRVVHPDNV